MFWGSDYMVHHTEQTVTTIKMISKCTTTRECSNSEGPYRFHLSDGIVYTYSSGAEYDIFAVLDYNMPPGITADYGSTPLECTTVKQRGMDAYAGGVQAGEVGMVAMQYVNPLSKTLSFYKVWFFFPNNIQHILVVNIQQSNIGSTLPIFSVLDQCLHSRDVYVNGSPSQSGNFTDAKSLWHIGTGYAFPTDRVHVLQASVILESRTGNWSKIGTSKVVPFSKDVFTAWIPHKKVTLNPGASNTGPGKYIPIEYLVFPAMFNPSEFKDKASQLRL